MADVLLRAGVSVRAFGLPQQLLSEGVDFFSDWRAAVRDCAVAVLPLPASPDSIHLNLPFAQEGESVRLFDLLEVLPDDALLAGGRFSPTVKELAERRGCRLFDYFDCEELQQKNALPTAEGAVAILMREIPRTVSGLSVAVTGYGRVAKALVKLLLAMEASVTVVARKQSDLDAAASCGARTLHLVGKSSLLPLTSGYDAVFNTVPYWLFDEEILSATDPHTLLIDLASAPGGVDAAAASAAGIRVIWALSLPGRYAPVTAGEIIAQTILSHLEKEELL